MSKKIVFGNDLTKELKKYGLNKIGEVPTKYKNGITTIYYMWSVVSNIDKLGYKTPYIEYTTDEETDGFIMGTMFPQGGDGLGTQFDTFEDIKYFISHAEYSNVDLTESLKEIEYYVGDETWQGFEIVKMENGKKFYLSKLAKNIKDSTWSSDHTYAKHFKNKSRAEEIVDEFNSLKEDLKESLKEGKGVKKSVDIIRRKLMELINDDTIQEEFTYAFDIGSTFDSVNDLFETSVHNILHELLEENTVEIIPF